MSKAGVNLRNQDVFQFRQVCQSNGIDPSKIPVGAIVNDDFYPSVHPLDAFAGLWVVWIRLMSPNSSWVFVAQADGGPPAKAQLVGWNEADGGGVDLPAWVDPWQQRVRAAGFQLHYGAPNVDNVWHENKPLEAVCSFVDRHIGATFAPPPAEIEGRPTVVTEIDVDPNYPETASEILPCAQRCLSQGTDAYVWGANPFQPDASLDPTVLRGILALNAKYDMPPNPLADAQAAYNAASGGRSFIPGKRYVQDNHDSSYTVVVTFPL